MVYIYLCEVSPLYLMIYAVNKKVVISAIAQTLLPLYRGAQCTSVTFSFQAVMLFLVINSKKPLSS